MTGPAQFSSQQGLVCCICAGPISLERSKTDERGRAVHEECYVRKMTLRLSFAGAGQHASRLNYGPNFTGRGSTLIL